MFLWTLTYRVWSAELVLTYFIEFIPHTEAKVDAMCMS